MFYIFVFLGGLSSLVYQITWQRLAAFSLGADAAAASVVAAAFMTGLGFGSFCGAGLSKGLSLRRCIIALSLIELAIGIFGVGSLPLLYQHFYLQLSGHLPSHTLAPLVFAVLSLPTFLMGVSFPLLVRVAVAEQSDAATRVTNLYALNTFGAALGALIGGLVLMRYLGIEGATLIAALINFVAAVLVILPLKRLSRVEVKSISLPESIKAPEAPVAAKQTFGAWCLLYGLSGFVNLGLELVWFRLLGIILKTNTFSFSWLLFFYLSGLAAGSLFAAKKLKNATGSMFLLLQVAITVYSVIFQIVLYRESQVGGQLVWLHDYFGSYNPLELSSYGLSALLSPEGELFRALYFGLALLMVFPPTFMMGISFYCLQNSVQSDSSLVSRRVGVLQSCNIVGGTLALLLIGLVGLDRLGTFNCLLTLFALNQIFLPVYFYIKYKETDVTAAKVHCIRSCLLYLALSSLPCLAMPNAQSMWSVLHGSKPDFIYKESHSGIAAVQTAYDDKYFVYVNGEGHSEIPFGHYHSQVGLAPLFLHPNPEDIAIIGLGSGDTCYSASSHKNTKSITCIEIVEAELDVLKKHAQKEDYKPLKHLFSDDRIKFVSGDGRRYIENSKKKFDIIQADALRPYTSRAGMLYSKEYFAAMQASLKPGGLVVTWLPTKRTYDTFRSVFPHHLYFGTTAIGSNQPINLDTALAIERYQQYCLHERMKLANLDGQQLVSQFLASVVPNDSSANFYDKHNRDLFPRDEFLLPQHKN